MLVDVDEEVDVEVDEERVDDRKVVFVAEREDEDLVELTIADCPTCCRVSQVALRIKP